MSIQLMNPLRACWARGFGRGGDMSSVLQKVCLLGEKRAQKLISSYIH
jgi:hypothetical protein